MDPITLSLLGGVALQAAGGLMSANAKRQAANFNAAVMETNAAYLGYQIADQARLGRAERQAVASAASRTRGQGRSSFAAGGVRLDTGTALDWEQSLAWSTEQDMATSRENQAQREWALGVEQQTLLAQAKLTRQQGKAQQQAALIGTAGSVLGGLGRF